MVRRVTIGFIGLLCGFALAVASTQLVKAADHCRAQDSDCYAGYAGPWARSDAMQLSYRAVGEPYQLGGGWFTDNNTNDGFHSTKGYEGLDCSGLVFKSWGLPYSLGQSYTWVWQDGHDAHGPYFARDMKAGCSGACFTLCSSGQNCPAKTYMDGYASETHMALYTTTDPYGNECVREATGTTIISHCTNYFRDSPDYSMIRRNLW